MILIFSVLSSYCWKYKEVKYGIWAFGRIERDPALAHTRYLSFFTTYAFFQFSSHESVQISTKHILQQNSKKRNKINFTRKKTAWFLMCGKNSDCRTFVWKNFRLLHLCLEISPHLMKLQISLNVSSLEIWNLSTWQIFSTDVLVVLVTNMRYAPVAADDVKVFHVCIISFYDLEQNRVMHVVKTYWTLKQKNRNFWPDSPDGRKDVMIDDIGLSHKSSAFKKHAINVACACNVSKCL